MWDVVLCQSKEREIQIGIVHRIEKHKIENARKTVQIETRWRMRKWKNRKISDCRDADWFWPDGRQYPISSQHHTDTLTV